MDESFQQCLGLNGHAARSGLMVQAVKIGAHRDAQALRKRMRHQLVSVAIVVASVNSFDGVDTKVTQTCCQNGRRDPVVQRMGQ